MKRLKPENKRRIAGIVAAVLVLAMVLSAMAPLFLSRAYADTTNTGFSIETQCGFDGRVKLQSYNSVKFNITNNSGKDFKGKFIVNNKERDDEYYYNPSYGINSYSKQVEIIDGNTISVEFDMYVEMQVLLHTISLQTDKGDIVYEEDISKNVKSASGILVGTLSNSPEDLQYLSPAYWGGNGEIVEITEDIINRDYNAFSAFNMIVVNDYDGSRLSEKRAQELIDWVKDGGTLIIGNPKDSTKAMDKLEVFTNSNWGEVSSPARISYFDYEQENESLVYDSIKYRYIGDGRVLVCDFDIGSDMSMIATATYQNNISQIYEGFSNLQESVYDYDGLYSDYSVFSNDYTDYRKNVILVLVYIYALAIGPVLYIVLKRKNKREMAVKIIPICAVLLTGVIYFISFNSAYRYAIANINTVFDMSAENIYCTPITTQLNVSTPYKGEVNLTAKGDFSVMIANKKYNYNRSNTNCTLNLEDNINIDYTGIEKWDRLDVIARNNMEYSGDIAVEANENGDKIVITNNTGYYIEDCVVKAFETYYAVGDIAIGESIEIGANSANMYSDFADIKSNNLAWFRDENGRLNYRGAVVNEYMANNNRPNVVIVGFNDEDLLGEGFKINNKRVTTNTTNAFCKTAYIRTTYNTLNQIDESDLDFSIPVSTNNSMYINEGQILLDGKTDRVELLVSGLKDLDVAYFNISIKGCSSAEIFDNSLGEWQRLDNAECSKNPQNYIDRYGSIKLRLNNMAGKTEIGLPNISVVVR